MATLFSHTKKDNYKLSTYIASAQWHEFVNLFCNVCNTTLCFLCSLQGISCETNSRTDPRPCSPSDSNLPNCWFSRGLHLYHPGYRQINWSSVRCQGRQNHTLWKGEHSSLAWQRLYAHPQVSHSLSPALDGHT